MFPQNLCDGEWQFFFEMTEGRNLSCVKILFCYLLGQLLFEILHTLSFTKTSKSVAKIECFF